MKYSIKTTDGYRYELPSGVVPELVRQFNCDWLMFQREGKTKYISVSAIVSITEVEND